ncbi:hypothetical protein FRC20_004062 [Serendipita sp. 405]|nr:hypothetical protein FRC18_000742 [Serendipita sp. 400]KAG8843116.1 hypothetical protein FRC20_004062 [Serendipita sp. 405]
MALPFPLATPRLGTITASKLQELVLSPFPSLHVPLPLRLYVPPPSLLRPFSTVSLTEHILSYDIDNANNPMPNGNGLPVTQVNNAGPNNLPPPPPPPPPAPAPPSAITTTAPNAKPEGSMSTFTPFLYPNTDLVVDLVADWNGPGGCVSSFSPVPSPLSSPFPPPSPLLFMVSSPLILEYPLTLTPTLPLYL